MVKGKLASQDSGVWYVGVSRMVGVTAPSFVGESVYACAGFTVS